MRGGMVKRWGVRRRKGDRKTGWSVVPGYEYLLRECPGRVERAARQAGAKSIFHGPNKCGPRDDPWTWHVLSHQYRVKGAEKTEDAYLYIHQLVRPSHNKASVSTQTHTRTEKEKNPIQKTRHLNSSSRNPQPLLDDAPWPTGIPPKEISLRLGRNCVV